MLGTIVKGLDNMLLKQSIKEENNTLTLMVIFRLVHNECSDLDGIGQIRAGIAIATEGSMELLVFLKVCRRDCTESRTRLVCWRGPPACQLVLLVSSDTESHDAKTLMNHMKSWKQELGDLK
jgi:hypothetical protein